MKKTTHKLLCIITTLFINLGLSHAVYAIPLNGLISIPSSTFSATDSLYNGPTFSLELGYDFVLDTTDYEGPVNNGESINGTSIKRFDGFHIIGDLLIEESLLVNLGFWDRRLANKRDKLSFHTLQGAAQYKLPWKWFNNNYAIRFGWWGDMAKVLTKSSYTQTDDYKITSIVLNEPVDNQYQFNLLATRPLGPGKQVTAFLGVGHSSVNYKSIEGEFTDKDGCDFEFELEQTAGVFNQIGQCNNILSRKITMPNTTSITNNLGFNPQDDIKYNSVFLQLGANAEWKKGFWHTRLGYYFQRFYRNGVDKRVEKLGAQSTKHNHSLTAEVSYRFSRPSSVFFRGEYVSSRLLTVAPFIYNSYTADRFSKDGLFFSVGLRLLL